MNNNKRRIRIGRINYTNVWPAFFYFADAPVATEVDMVLQLPSELNQSIITGDIDVAPISSFAYALHHDELMLLPNLSVSAYGEVKSILLFHHKPLSELANSRIALSNTSATSVHLLQIIMKNCFHTEPEYIFTRPKLDQMLHDSDAALLIGDDAIKASWNCDPSCHVTDLGELWRRWTGEWMSYAVWAVRKDTLEQYPQLIDQIHHAFVSSKQKSLQQLPILAKTAQLQVGGEESFWSEYFLNLCYDFNDLQKRGLDMYYKYAFEMGWLEQSVPIQIWANKSTV